MTSTGSPPGWTSSPAVAEEKAGAARAARDAARLEAIARKTALVEEAEQIGAESTGWKTAGDRLKEILDEWKTIHGVDKKTDSELWKRYSPRPRRLRPSPGRPLRDSRCQPQAGPGSQGRAGRRGGDPRRVH